jgi:uncharacterized repeat protein (TIGR03803 family)
MTNLWTHKLFTSAMTHRRRASNVFNLSFGIALSYALLFCLAAVIAAPAQSAFFTTVANFDWTNGALPYSSLIQATDGNFYGTTYWGGPNQSTFGTVFKMTPSGTLTTIYNFCSLPNCTDGFNPYDALVQASDGNFYGTTLNGGTNCNGGCGTVFKITPAGVLTTLHNFAGPDGSNPYAGLVQANDGNFYGTTLYGGANQEGAVFKITPSGTFTTLYSFCGQPGCPDGSYPVSGLVQASDGNLYGTTMFGGTNIHCGPNSDYGCGTVFKITLAGAPTIIYNFCSQPNCADGYLPTAGLLQGADGNLYGTTYSGGAFCGGNGGCGTVFKTTLAGALTSLHSFDGADGLNPFAGLVQGTDGNFYGTTVEGGIYEHCNGVGCGTVFRITPAGVLTSLHSFCSQLDCTDGRTPEAGLVQATDGNFYGTTEGGGGDYLGSVFRLGLVRTCAACRE